MPLPVLRSASAIGGRLDDIDQLVEGAEPGFLVRLGRTLDTPGRIVRSALLGEEDATGWDIVRRLTGLRDRPGFFQSEFPFFDPVDVAAFGAEVVLDPLTYLTGGLSKAGKAAEAAGHLSGFQRAGQSALARQGALSPQTALRIQQALRETGPRLQALSGAARLGKTLPERVRLGQSGLQLNVPFTRPRAMLHDLPGGGLIRPVEQAGAEVLSRLGRGLGQTYLGQKLLKGFSRAHYLTPAGRMARLSPELRGQRELTDLIQRVSGREAREAGEQVGRGLEAAGIRLPEELESFRDVREGVLPPGTMEEANLADEIRQMTEASRRRREVAGAPAEALQDDVLYAERILSPEGRQALQGAGDLQAFLREARALQAAPKALRTAREESLRGSTTEAMRKLSEKYGVESFFELDPSKSLPQALGRSGRATAAALHHRGLVDNFGEPIPAKGTPPEGMVRASDYLKQAGLRLPKEEFEKLKSVGVPKRFADEAMAVAEAIRAPDTLNRFLRNWQAVSQWYRLGFTSPFPGFHARNMFSNIALSTLFGVTPLDYMRAFRMMRDPEAKKLLEDVGITRRGFYSDVERLGTTAGRSQFFPGPFDVPGIRRVSEAFTGVNKAVEETSRIALYNAAIRKGLTSAEASDIVRRYLFNYDELTPFEKSAMKSVAFFYTWQRNVIPLMFREMLENTGRMQAMFRLGTLPSIEREPTPEWLRETLAVPAGEDTFVTGLGLPVEEFAKFDLSQADPGVLGTAKEVGRKAAQQMLPLLRVPLEAMAGEDFFRRQPLLEADRPPDIFRKEPLRSLTGTTMEQTAGGRVVPRTDPELLYALRNSPIGRFLSTAGKFADPQRTTGDALLNFLTGVRTFKFDPEERRLNIAQDEAQKILQGFLKEGRAETFPVFYSRRGPEGERDPEVQELLRLLREISKERRERRESE